MAEKLMLSKEEISNFQLKGKTEMVVDGRRLIFYRGKEEGVTVIKSETPYLEPGREINDLCVKLWGMEWPEFVGFEVREDDPRFVLVRHKSKF